MLAQFENYFEQMFFRAPSTSNSDLLKTWPPCRGQIANMNSCYFHTSHLLQLREILYLKIYMLHIMNPIDQVSDPGPSWPSCCICCTKQCWTEQSIKFLTRFSEGKIWSLVWRSRRASTFLVRTITLPCIEIFSKNLAQTCTISRRCAKCK